MTNDKKQKTGKVYKSKIDALLVIPILILCCGTLYMPLTDDFHLTPFLLCNIMRHAIVQYEVHHTERPSYSEMLLHIICGYRHSLHQKD